MRVPIDVPIIVNLAGGKGGAGTSTFSANLAYALGSTEAAYGYIGVIDTALGANSTLSKLLGIPPLVSNGFWNYIFSRFCDQNCGIDYSPNVDVKPEPIQHMLVVTSGTYTALQIDWGLAYITARLGSDPYRVGWALHDVILELILERVMRGGANLVLVDVPSTISRPLVWALLMMARIVNVVVKAGSTHQDEAMETLQIVREVLNQRTSMGMPPFDVVLIVNQAMPGDNTVNDLKARGAPMTEARVLPASPAVQVITDRLKEPAVKYDVPEDKYFRKWREEVLSIARREYEMARGRPRSWRAGPF